MFSAAVQNWIELKECLNVYITTTNELRVHEFDGSFHPCRRDISLTSRVFGLYCKLQTKFFSHQFMTQARGSQTEEKNEANKMFIYRAFCLRDYKKVQNKRYDSQLTGDKIFKH